MRYRYKLSGIDDDGGDRFYYHYWL